MESARKASEIHKKRTGKDLVITRDLVQSEADYLEESGEVCPLLLPTFSTEGYS